LPAVFGRYRRALRRPRQPVRSVLMAKRGSGPFHKLPNPCKARRAATETWECSLLALSSGGNARGTTRGGVSRTRQNPRHSLGGYRDGPAQTGTEKFAKVLSPRAASRRRQTGLVSICSPQLRLACLSCFHLSAQQSHYGKPTPQGLGLFHFATDGPKRPITRAARRSKDRRSPAC
jgi:hypothetical protein